MATLVTVANTLISAIVDGSGLPELDRQRLLASVGLSDALIRDIAGRTSILVLGRLWKRLLRATGDDFLGVRIGTVTPGERFGLGARAAAQSNDLGAALGRLARYASLINDLLECDLDAGASLARFAVRLHWDVFGLERHAVDIMFAAIVAWARDHLAVPLVIREVRVRHARVAAATPYAACFAAPIVFGADRNELVFDAAALTAPAGTRDSQLGMLLERYARQELDAIPVVTDLPARLAQVIRQRLRAGEPVGLAALAAAVQHTPRRLQRRLRDHATSFSTVLDDVRRALAPELLARPDAGVEQVGTQLGYSEPTAFIRAFKKWFGQTPGAFRRARTV